VHRARPCRLNPPADSPPQYGPGITLPFISITWHRALMRRPERLNEQIARPETADAADLGQEISPCGREMLVRSQEECGIRRGPTCGGSGCPAGFTNLADRLPVCGTQRKPLGIMVIETEKDARIAANSARGVEFPNVAQASACGGGPCKH
jgi:hypothetical protein